MGELPPRARRIHTGRGVCIMKGGTTSACAENTSQNALGQNAPRNYLRVRGEYIARDTTGAVNQELPPRARRILNIADTLTEGGGTTSACAENTLNIR